MKRDKKYDERGNREEEMNIYKVSTMPQIFVSPFLWNG